MAASLGVSRLKATSSVVEYYPSGNGVSAEAEESALLEVITRKRLMDTVTD
jgi:hypothetical protein